MVRALGPWMAVAIVVGTIIGSGVFKKPQQVAETAPYFGLAALAWILGGVLALLGSLALAEVAVLYPHAGGNYVYLREAYGRLAAFLWGWVEFWMIRGASIAALATVFSESLHDVLANARFREAVGLPPATQVLDYWQQRGLTVAVILTLALVNVRGVRWGGVLQLFITLVKIGSLLAIAVLPFVVGWLFAGSTEDAGPRAENLEPWWPGSWKLTTLTGFGSALLGVMWAYHGWMNIAPVAGEVQNPNRNLPLAFLAGTGIVIFLYLAANLAYALVLPVEEMARCKDTPVATVFSERLLGPIGAALASAAVMCSAFGALNGNLLVGPRVLYAMGDDRLAPPRLAAIHPRFHTPAVAIVVLALWSALLVVVAGALSKYRLPTFAVLDLTIDPNIPENKSVFNILTDFAMFGATTFETLAVATIFVFRRTAPDAERAYRCRGYPWVPAIYVAILALVVVNIFWTQWSEALFGLGFITLGALVFAGVFGRRGAH
ncbi:MAG: amino acid permease [Planctomycetia bacterium]|nr:amino acid permease [Planctomycetia bacterium]